jgi:hypothetical protein
MANNIDSIRAELKKELERQAISKDSKLVYKTVLKYKNLGVTQLDMYNILAEFTSNYYDRYGDDQFYDSLYDTMDAVYCEINSQWCIYGPDYVMPEWAK